MSESVQKQLHDYSKVLVQNCSAAIAPSRLKEAWKKATVSSPPTEISTPDRKLNLVLFGLQETTARATEHEVRDVFDELNEKPVVTTIKRVGLKTDDRARPVIVTLERRESLLQLLRKAKQLKSSEKFSSVFLSPDLSAEEQRERKSLVDTLKELKRDNPNGRYWISRGIDSIFTRCILTFLSFHTQHALLYNTKGETYSEQISGWKGQLACKLMVKSPIRMSFDSQQQDVDSVIPRDYFSIDSILAEQQKLSCVLRRSFFGLGYLDASNSGEHLVSGTKMDLPLWVVGSGLADKGFLTCELPKAYQEANRNILLADSSVVDLFKQSPSPCISCKLMVKSPIRMSFDSQQQDVDSVIPRDYFSIDSILAEQQKLSCVLRRSFFGLGYLDASNSGEHLVSGTKMDLPLWVVGSGLADKGFLTCELPKAYQEANRNILLADSSVVDLFKQAVHFYGTGLRLIKLPHPETPYLAVSLVKAFIGRFKKIMDSSQNSRNQDISTLCAKLDTKERALFELSRESVQTLDNSQLRMFLAHNMTDKENISEMALLDMTGILQQSNMQPWDSSQPTPRTKCASSTTLDHQINVADLPSPPQVPPSRAGDVWSRVDQFNKWTSLSKTLATDSYLDVDMHNNCFSKRGTCHPNMLKIKRNIHDWRLTDIMLYKLNKEVFKFKR
eukprot:sb/3462731/